MTPFLYYIFFLCKGKQTEAEIYDTYFYTQKQHCFLSSCCQQNRLQKVNEKKILFTYKIKEVAIRAHSLMTKILSLKIPFF